MPDSIPLNKFSGALLFDKPQDITSHDAVELVRRRLKFKKIGHTGTLDPMATGLLVLLLGPATKLQGELQGCAKIYEGRIRLGIETDTWDARGAVLSEKPCSSLDAADVERVVKGSFSGLISQQVPSYSAVKHQGKRYHTMARENIVPPVIYREVTITWNKFKFIPPLIDFEIACSGGTYIRSIAHELGLALGTGGHLAVLRRLQVKNWNISGAIDRDTLFRLSAEEIAKKLIPIERTV